MKSIFLSTLALLTSVACNAQSQYAEANNKTTPKYTYNTVRKAQTLAEAYYSNDAELYKLVEQAMSKMTPQEKAAQMIMAASSETLGFTYLNGTQSLVKNKQAANVLFLKGNKKDFIKQSQELKGYTIADMEPLFACDCEPTLLHNKFPGEPKMRATSLLKTVDEVNASVDSVNTLMDEMGITINFAPIADIAVNKDIINRRSFGNNPNQIVNLAGAFINRTQTNQKVATIKHFPGHGAVTGDTHKQSVAIKGKMTELPTFDRLIKEHQPLMVMVGHISVSGNPEGYNTENNRPATTSPRIMKDLLRDSLGFRGIIVTDAMNMQASKNFPNADWEAAKAGADLILMPLNPAILNKKIADEIAKGSALGKQFEASVRRIVRLKLAKQQLQNL